MVTRRRRGYSLLEMVVAMAVFGMFLFIVTALTMSLNRSEKKWPVNLMKHPQVAAVMARLRRDVLDATPPYYGEATGAFKQTAQTLLLTVLEPGGTSRSIVWDFSIPGEAHRRAFLGDEQVSEWVARGIPSKFEILAADLGREPVGLRIQARDEHGALAIDQLLQPRATLPPSEKVDPEEEATPSAPPPMPPFPTETAAPVPTETAPTETAPTETAPTETISIDTSGLLPDHAQTQTDGER
jgi:prepilin-type N-terminal cleavage/methylation domain-containing protein